MKLLRELFGDRAEDALEELRRMGMDPEALAQATGLGSSPAVMDHVLQRIRLLMADSQSGAVNWTLAHEVARGVAAQGGDPSITAAVAAEHRSAITRAELWLDAATEFAPSTETPFVWSRAEWVENTLPTWRMLAGPVATSVSHALGAIVREGTADDDGDDAAGGTDEWGAAGSLAAAIAPTVCGMHVGQAAGAMAVEAFGATDLGIPLLEEPRVALVPRAVSAFAEGLDVDIDSVRVFLALREAAHVRLFGAAPWLSGQLRGLIERYAKGVTIDERALDEAVQGAGSVDPAELQKALSRGIFVSARSEDQDRILASIEALLALIEGWVEDVTTRAAAPHLPQIGSLREMMRRRRAAGGPAEDTFATLLGLELRPRRARDAAAMWAALVAAEGPEARDAVWQHPESMPTGEDLAEWKTWLDARLAGASQPDAVDRELEQMLRDEGDTSSTN